MSTALLFFAAFLLMLLTAAIMSALGRKFMTHRVTDRSFDIMDLEFPVNAAELRLIINGIYRLPDEDSKKSAQALKAQLFVDFLFMPAAYGTIYLLCQVVAYYMPEGWFEFFQAVGYVQLLAWLCDIGENLYLLVHLHPYDEKEPIKYYRVYQFFVYTKWFTALIGAVCGCAAIAFLLFSGLFPSRWYLYLGVVIVSIVVYWYVTSHKHTR